MSLVYSNFEDKVAFFDPIYQQALFFKIAMVLLIVGGLNWLMVGLLDVDIVEAVFGRGVVSSLIYVLVGVSAVAIMFNRDTYLPFLGKTLAPCAAFVDRVPAGATRDVTVKVEPFAKVLYWASEPSTSGIEKIVSWKKAYGQYENAGVATADANGIVVLKVREPQPYAVPWKGELKTHVHYRVCDLKRGFMERVETVWLGEGVQAMDMLDD
jgi:uncharacterized membrane protein YuzA (DUF378 family)